MSIRILTKNGIDNTNIDGARDHNFNAGRRSGIVKGVGNECNIFSSANNVIAIDTCELRLCGHRIVIDEVVYKTFTNIPASAIRYSIVARVVVDNENNVLFDAKIQSINEPLITDNLDKTGVGTFELELGRFTLQTDGTITDIVRTADIITGGIGDLTGGAINVGNVTTNTLEAGMEAEVDVEQRYDEQEKKTFTDFTFSIPKGEQGLKGDKGIQGEKGDTGSPAGFGVPTASIDGNIGTPSVTITASGENTEKVFNFEFKNLKGEKGEKGNTGATPQISTMAITLSSGSSATAMISGSAENPKITFGIPKGEKGDKGEKGESGLIYQTTGQNTDGAMSQKATTDELTAIATALSNKFSNHAQSAYDCNTCYDEGVYLIASGSNCPSGSQYGSLFVMPYRKPTGNTKPDFGVQIFIPNGDDNSKPNSMFYRTSLENTWNAWREVATTYELTYKMSKSGGTFTGPVKFNEGDTGCIRYNNKFYISQELSGGVTSTLLGTNGTHSYVGNVNTELNLYGNSDRPFYYKGSAGRQLAFYTDIPSVPSITSSDLGIGTNIEAVTSWYATWRIDIGDIKIIGGATPGQEGKKTINFRMNNATGTNVFTSKIYYFGSNGRYQTTSTANGWQYSTVTNLSSGYIVQISHGSYWFAIGK